MFFVDKMLAVLFWLLMGALLGLYLQTIYSDLTWFNVVKRCETYLF
jgi:hypothetical protein